MALLLVSGQHGRRSCLPRNTRSVVEVIRETFSEIFAGLGKAEVAHQVWQEV
jgi:hypothetical protein